MGWKRGILVAVFALLLPGAGQGQPSAACAEDAARLCADAAPGRRGVSSCLKSHRAELSAQCGAEVDQEAAKRRQMHRMREACGEDVRELCDEIDSTPDRIACLRGHDAQLSAACRDALPPDGS